jgi:AraC-like DNA-binding protein
MTSLDDHIAASDIAELPLARYHLYSTTSPEAASNNLCRALSPHLPAQHGGPELSIRSDKFECTHNAIELPNVSINAISYGGPISLGLHDVSNRLFLVLVLRGHCNIVSRGGDFTLGPNEMFVINSGEAIQAHLSEDFQEIVIALDSYAIGSVFLRLIDRPISIPLYFDWGPTSFSRGGESLVRIIHLLCADMEADRPALEIKAIGDLYEQMLLSLLLTSVPHNYSQWLHKGVPAAIPFYVHRAERFIRENLRSQITLDEIVAVSGVGMRSLHYGFRNFRRTTPMLFLKECRLQLARRQLQSDVLLDRSVAEIAQRAGFEHPSKFSQAYKLRFDELPSATRRRRWSS